MQNIEVELKSLITREEYFKLLNYFNDLLIFRGEENELVYIYDTDNELKLKQANLNSSVLFKEKDEKKREIDVKFDKDDFLLMHRVLTKLGIKKKIEWRKSIMVFNFKNIDVFLEHTKAYGYILRMRIITTEEFRDDAVQMLGDKFNEFDIKICSPEDFSERHEKYKNNWRELLSEG